MVVGGDFSATGLARPVCIEVAEKWDEQVYRMRETITREKAYAAPHRGSTTQQLQGRDDDRDRPRGCLEPLLHAQRRWRSCGPGPVSYQSIGSREVVYRSASGADRDGSGHALDLDQRAASGTGSRSDRGERARTAGDLAQRSEERSGGCGEAGSIRAARSEDPASDCPSYGGSAGSTDVDPRPHPNRSSADSGGERGARVG